MEDAEDALLMATPPSRLFRSRSAFRRWILSCAICICSVCRRSNSACSLAYLSSISAMRAFSRCSSA